MKPLKRKSLRLLQEESRIEEARIEASRIEAATITSNPQLTTSIPSSSFASPQSTSPSNLVQPTPPPAPPLRNRANPGCLSPTQAPPLPNNPPDKRYRNIRCSNKEGVNKARRTVISRKTATIVKVSGRIKPEWCEVHRGPKSREHWSLLVHDLGNAIKSHVSMFAPTFYELKPEEKNEIDIYLSVYYDIPKTDLNMWEFIHEKCQKMYNNWRYWCHMHYKEYGDEITSNFLNRSTQWDYLLSLFKDKEKQVVYARNQANRTKNPNPMNHHSGKLPHSRRAEEFRKQGSLNPHIKAAAYAYAPCENAKEIVEILDAKMDEIKEKRAAEDPDNQEPIPIEEECEVIIGAFGERKCKEIKGMGAAYYKPSKISRRSPFVATQEATERVEQDEERAREAREMAQEAADANERARQNEERAWKMMEAAKERARLAEEERVRARQADDERYARLEALYKALDARVVGMGSHSPT